MASPVVVAFLGGLGWDLVAYQSTLLHGALYGALAAGAAFTVVKMTGHRELAWVAGLSLAIWGPGHPGSATLLILAIVPALVLLYCPARRSQAASVAMASSVVIWLLDVGGLKSTLVAGAVAAAVAWMRVDAPTEETVRGVRFAALVLPAGGLAAALAFNAATKRAEHLAIPQALAVGVGLAALFAFLSMALLGLLTLFESSSPHAPRAWTAMASLVGVAAAGLYAEGPVSGSRLVVTAAIPLTCLAAVAASRLRHTLPDNPVVAVFALSAPVLLSGLQFELF